MNCLVFQKVPMTQGNGNYVKNGRALMSRVISSTDMKYQNKLLLSFPGIMNILIGLPMLKQAMQSTIANAIQKIKEATLNGQFIITKP